MVCSLRFQYVSDIRKYVVARFAPRSSDASSAWAQHSQPQDGFYPHSAGRDYPKSARVTLPAIIVSATWGLPRGRGEDEAGCAAFTLTLPVARRFRSSRAAPEF
jgi:hypothetical protein